MIQRYGIVHHPLGGYAAVFYEADVALRPIASVDHEQFDNLDDAISLAESDPVGCPVRVWVEAPPVTRPNLRLVADLPTEEPHITRGDE